MTELKKTSGSKTSLKSGTPKCTFNLTSSDICEIIKTCGEAGAKDFEGYGLRVSFQTREEERQVLPYIHPLDQEATIKDKGVEKKLLREEELNHVEHEIAEKLITNPAEYESLLLQNEFMEE